MKHVLLLFSIILMSATLLLPKQLVEGYVRDSVTGEGIPGVSVLIKGTTIGTVTDANGYFQIEVPPGGVLVFQAIGMTSQEVAVKDQTSLNVSLGEDVQGLQEVVVSGFSTRKKGRRKSKKRYARLSSRYASESQPSNESYATIEENGFQNPRQNPLSTFSIDVDRAAYSNVRRFLNQGELPPKDAVRIEEMINYFSYDYPQPQKEHPFAIYTELGTAPWNSEHQLLHVGIQGLKMATEDLPPSNLVFLIDVSGSMNRQNKLPLVKASMRLLVDQLRPQDRVAIVVYAGAAGKVLPSTSGENKDKILAGINKLSAGGSTAGGAGIRLAYKIAEKHFLKNGNNRIILATDGDFNVGVSSDQNMKKLIEQKRETGIYLTCLGFGMGNYKDSKMEILADKGNGNYAYIDNMLEAQKMMVAEFGGTLFTIAKDVKLQLEFNPVHVQAYRLIGYENRVLDDEDFNDDTKDAGELGAGHTVTALYEIIPAGVENTFTAKVDPLKYQKELVDKPSALKDELLTIKFRYKPPKEKKSRLIVHTVPAQAQELSQTSESYRFAASVAGFGMLLRESEYFGSTNLESLILQAQESRGEDAEGYRAEFIRLMKTSKPLVKPKLRE